MPSCSSCGSEIPEGQGSSCSMCYGDIDHGNDGYYRDYVEQCERASSERRAEEEQQIREEIEQRELEEHTGG